jgi:hypothetical protein
MVLLGSAMINLSASSSSPPPPPSSPSSSASASASASLSVSSYFSFQQALFISQSFSIYLWHTSESLFLLSLLLWLSYTLLDYISTSTSKLRFLVVIVTLLSLMPLSLIIVNLQISRWSEGLSLIHVAQSGRDHGSES